MGQVLAFALLPPLFNKLFPSEQPEKGLNPKTSTFTPLRDRHSVASITDGHWSCQRRTQDYILSQTVPAPNTRVKLMLKTGVVCADLARRQRKIWSWLLNRNNEATS